jgi:hypothetical protein
MKGDFTRNTFDPARNFSRVLMQQGRVTLDADFNEQTAILLSHLRYLALDMFGPHAGPKDGAGFAIVTPIMGSGWQAQATALLKPFHTKDEVDKIINTMEKNSDFLIGAGRYYVGGLHVINPRPLLYSDQEGYAHFDPANQIGNLRTITNKQSYLFYLDVWELPVTALELDLLREVALGGPDTCMRARVNWQVRAAICPSELQGNDANGNPLFTCGYVDTLPGLGTGKLRARARLDKPPVDLCAIPPESRYRGAENQLYRVEIHAPGAGAPSRPIRGVRALNVVAEDRVIAKLDTVSLDHASTTNAAPAPGAAAAPAPAAPAPPPAPPATPAPVEVANPVALKTDIATFVWSRENGSVVLPLLSLADPTAVVSFLGRDRRLGLKPGDLVEVTDDSLADAGLAGPLAEVKTVDPDKMTVTLQFAKQGPTRPAYTQSDVDTLHPRLIRWDKTGDMDADGAIQVVEGPDETEPNSGWIELEDGVQIRFEPGGTYRVGDYWLIPARVVTGDVEWPRIADNDGNPVALPRGARGERHFYAPLSLIGIKAGSAAPVDDCRCLIARQQCTGK